MSDLNEQMIFKPAYAYIDDGRYGMLSKFEPGTQLLKAGYQLEPSRRPLTCDIIFEKDVPVKLRDGVTIYTDIFRPACEEKVPVIVSWSCYGKSGGTASKYDALFNHIIGIPPSTFSGFQKFEGSDPAYWCAQGYAVCNPDARGIAYSEGDIYYLGTQEGRDGYDVIEWVAAHDWCNGKVALSGTSYLAISQWFIAAEQPPHLAAINPNEGLSDLYRDWGHYGGVPDPNFLNDIQTYHVSVNKDTKREDVAEEVHRYPYADHKIWQDKIARVENILCPAYVVASYSNTLHLVGTFRAWRNMRQSGKWLRIHDSQEWPDYYNDANTEDRRRFFDHFLKGLDNGWEETPRVRYALHDMEGGNRVGLPADAFPPAGTEYRKLYLNAGPRSFSSAPVPKDIPAEYISDGKWPRVSFLYKAEKEIKILGYPKAKLWVEVDGHDNMDLMAALFKLDRNGNQLSQITIPNHTARIHDFTDEDASIMRLRASNGVLRVSRRHLDKEKSTDEVPVHTFDRDETLGPGEVVPIEIAMSPIGLLLYPGEQLRLVITSKNILGYMMPTNAREPLSNQGKHIIHCGGAYNSYLQLPFLE